MPVQAVSEATGQGLLIGLSVAFAVIVPLIALLDRKLDARASNFAPSEMFTSGGKSLRLAFTCTVICAQWVWVSRQTSLFFS